MYVLSGASWARSGGQGLPGRVGDTGLASGGVPAWGCGGKSLENAESGTLMGVVEGFSPGDRSRAPNRRHQGLERPKNPGFPCNLPAAGF